MSLTCYYFPLGQKLHVCDVWVSNALFTYLCDSPPRKSRHTRTITIRFVSYIMHVSCYFTLVKESNGTAVRGPTDRAVETDWRAPPKLKYRDNGEPKNRYERLPAWHGGVQLVHIEDVSCPVHNPTLSLR